MWALVLGPLVLGGNVARGKEVAEWKMEAGSTARWHFVIQIVLLDRRPVYGCT